MEREREKNQHTHSRRMHVLVDGFPAAARGEEGFVVDADVLVRLPVLVPPGPAFAVGGAVREGVQVLD